MIREDCCMFDSRKIICTGLSVLVCCYSDECSFYKTAEQARAEHEKCRQRLERLELTGKYTGPAQRGKAETVDNA